MSENLYGAVQVAELVNTTRLDSTIEFRQLLVEKD
jgi:hypothetical protein